MKILTFDIEEWFHILDNESTKSEQNWLGYESRIHQNMDTILGFLLKNKLSATFFVVGWIAKKYPEIVRRIDNHGFEIGSHSHMHQLLYNLSKNEVEDDLIKSISVLQDITGKKIRCFRAPGFSIVNSTKWVFDILFRNGIEIDCSIFPAARAHGGIPTFAKSSPSLVSHNGVKIKEFPINTVQIFNNNFVFSGGGYFRVLPYNLIKHLTAKSEYVMSYFHPRDFDSSQPVINELSLLRKFKSYVGLKHSLNKLQKWTSDFHFIDIEDANSQIDWSKISIIDL